MQRRTLLATVPAALLAGTGLAGCSSDSGSGKLRFLSLAWQKESVAANKKLVAEWNRRHPDAHVQYVQGSWDNVHDQLVTAFEGGDPPDVIHDDSPDMAGFAAQNYLQDLKDLRPSALTSDISRAAWETVTIDGGVYGVPFLEESQVFVANRTMLARAKVRIPTVETPWTWDEFADVCRKLTVRGRTYGTAWPLKQPVNKVLNLALNFDGTFFTNSGGKSTVKVGAAEQEVLRRIHAQLWTDRSADPSTVGMSGSDPLPGFYAGKYAMVPGGVYFRQQVVEQAPKGFDWVTIPPLKGTSQHQGATSQTLSIAAQSKNQKQAMEFIAFMLNGKNQATLALGDWLLPTSRQAAKDPRLTTSRYGWDIATASQRDLVQAPYLKVNGFDEWTEKVATPAMQGYFGNKLSLDALSRKLVTDGNAVLKRYQK
ncbi:MAG: sugar ABC transporter substrate-binding protein [Actinocatenispora sp.]